MWTFPANNLASSFARDYISLKTRLLSVLIKLVWRIVLHMDFETTQVQLIVNSFNINGRKRR